MSAAAIPERMRRNGRPMISYFEKAEWLYRRFRRDDLYPEESGLWLRQLKFHPDMSVNRERFSQPHDVLYAEPDGFENWGVCSLQVADAPPPMETGGGVRFDWRVEHIPEEDNYGHSEIRTFRDGARDEGRDISSKELKKAVRLHYFSLFRRNILYQPGEALERRGL